MDINITLNKVKVYGFFNFTSLWFVLTEDQHNDRIFCNKFFFFLADQHTVTFQMQISFSLLPCPLVSLPKRCPLAYKSMEKKH